MSRERDCFDLSGKIVAVIGGGSGIGEAVAIGAARAGRDVVVLDINDGGGGSGRARSRGAGAARRVDIGDAASVERGARDDRRASAAGSTSLVCTPSINVRKPILDYTGEEFDRVVDVNLNGNFNVLQGGRADHDGAEAAAASCSSRRSDRRSSSPASRSTR